MPYTESLNIPRWLMTFAKIVECGGISAGARYLHIDKAVASRHLRELEVHMGAQLLNRSTHESSLTEVGKLVYARAARIAGELKGVRCDIEQLSAGPVGDLVVGTSVAFGNSQLVPLLPSFMRANAGITVQLQLLDRHVSLIDEGLDVLVRICDAPPPALAARRLCASTHVVVASPALLASGLRITQPEDLAGVDCLFYRTPAPASQWSFTHRHAATGTPARSVTVSGRLQVNSSEAVLGLAKAGMGVALMPRFAAAHALRAGELVCVLPDYIAARAAAESVYCIYLPGRYLPGKTRAFMDFLVTHWSPTPPWEDSEPSNSSATIGVREPAAPWRIRPAKPLRPAWRERVGTYPVAPITFPIRIEWVSGISL
ncbi:LysR family transcriptional regulator [soil metagenome]